MKRILFKHQLFVSLLVISPVIAFIIGHYLMNSEATGTLATGFFNGEAPYYMANARQYLDHGFNSLFYANPFSYLEEGQRVYFQFQTYILAILLKITPFDVGTIWVFFGLFFGIAFIVQACRLFCLLELDRKYLLYVILLFAWGGGGHAILGFSSEFFTSFNFLEGIRQFEKFEIAEGWWMHSVGRNFLMPNYIYYHFLVMTGIIFIVNRNNRALILLCFVLSLSHPFVGAQFISSVVVWRIFDKFYLKNNECNYFSLIPYLIILLFHVGYYFKFLHISSEHAAQEAQWAVSAETLYENWAMRAINFIPSYIFVFGLFLYQIRSPILFLRFFQSPVNRFLFAFGSISFILANHEFLMKPIQPIHFTHGMVWVPFFLLGITSVIQVLKAVKSDSFQKRAFGICFCLLFISDNLTWIAKRAYQTHKGNSQTEIRLTHSQDEVINFINEKNIDNKLFFVSDRNLGYHLAVYTSSRVYASHNIITPNSNKRRLEQQEFIKSGLMPGHIKERVVYLIREHDMFSDAEGEILFSNKKYEVLKMIN